MLGGIKGNARANTVQNIIGGIALVVLTFWLATAAPRGLGQTSPWQSPTYETFVAAIGLGGVVTNIVFSLLWQFVDMSTWQTLASASTTDAANKKSLRNSAIWIFFFPGVFGTFIGMYLRGTDGLDPNSLMPHVIDLLRDNSFLLFFVVMGLVCAMLSTLDGLLLSIGQAIRFDIMKDNGLERVMAWREQNSGTSAEIMPAELLDVEHSSFNNIRNYILGAALGGAALVVLITQYFKINIFDVVYIVIIAQLVLFPSIWRCLKYSGKTGKGGAESIWAGLVLGIILVVVGIATGHSDFLQYVPLLSLALSFATLRYFDEGQ